MAKVTSKLQVTVPKAVADRLGIRPGDQLDWRVEGGSARVVRTSTSSPQTVRDRLARFDESTERQKVRNRAWDRQGRKGAAPAGRGWTREELYARGHAR